jgi:hypothetical protein
MQRPSETVSFNPYVAKPGFVMTQRIIGPWLD